MIREAVSWLFESLDGIFEISEASQDKLVWKAALAALSPEDRERLEAQQAFAKVLSCPSGLDAGTYV